MVELLVTIGLLGAIAGLALPAYGAMQRNIALNGASQELADAIRSAQTRAISSQGGVHHGLRFEANQLVWLELDPTTGVQTDASFHSIGAQITNCVGCSVMFTKLTGTTNLGGLQSIDITLSGQDKTITIEPNGQINLL